MKQINISMKNILIIALTLIITTAAAQTEKFTKKTWKTFNKSFEENINAAKEFYNGNIDYENRNEDNGMPTPKIKLPNITSSYLDASGYSASYNYNFETEEKAKEFLKELMDNLKIPDKYVVIDDEGTTVINSENEEGKNPSIMIDIYDNVIGIRFAPPWDVSIPMDIK